MAKIKFTAIVADGRGKLNGTVFSKNRSGAYMRTKVSPVNRQSPAQMEVRQRFGSLSAGWRDLTEEQRLSWNGATGDWTGTNVFGDTRTPSGQQLYIRLNQVLLNNSVATLDFPPTPGDLGVIEITSSLVIFNTATNRLEVTVAGNASAEVGGRSIQIEATPGLSAGKSFIKTQFRVIAKQSVLGPSFALLVSVPYAQILGSAAVGSKVAFRLRVVDLSTGQQGVPVTSSTIVEAL